MKDNVQRKASKSFVKKLGEICVSEPAWYFLNSHSERLVELNMTGLPTASRDNSGCIFPSCVIEECLGATCLRASKKRKHPKKAPSARPNPADPPSSGPGEEEGGEPGEDGGAGGVQPPPAAVAGNGHASGPEALDDSSESESDSRSGH